MITSLCGKIIMTYVVACMSIDDPTADRILY